MSTNFITPNELKQQQEKIARRKRMAELIRASAATPIESPGVAGAKTSPWQVLIKALQGGIGGYEESQANKEEKALLARQDAAEENANTQFAAGQYQYAPQEPIPPRSPNNITPTETFAVPDSLTPHQAPEMLPGADQAQYLASIAPTVTSQIPQQVPGREMPPPPPMQFGSPYIGQNANVAGTLSQQRAAEFLDEMRRSPQPLGIPPGVDPAEYLASSAPTDTSQIPEPVPGREMPPPNDIRSLVAALGQNKKSNEYVDQRRLALANVLNSKDPNKIKFMLDQMGSREQFEQQRQLASEQAGYGLTAAELKYLRDVETAKTLAGVNQNTALTKARVDATAALDLAGVRADAASKQAGVRADAALDLANVNKTAASDLAKVRADAASLLNQETIKAAKLLAAAKSLENLNRRQESNGAKNPPPVGVQTSAIMNQQLLTETERALKLLDDPIFGKSLDLGSLVDKALWPRGVPKEATELFSILSRISTTQVLDITGQAATKRDMESINPMIPLIGGGLFGSKADTLPNAKVKLKELLRYFQGKKNIVETTYDFSVKGGDSPPPGEPDSPPPGGPTAEQWERLTQEQKDKYLAIGKK